MGTYNTKANKDVRYTGRDFNSLKTNLIEFAKNYFPSTVKDFTEASPSTMFIEMAAYVGDVLSYYTDYALKETMLHRAQEKANVYAIAQAFGYKPNISSPATANLTVYCLIPSTGTGTTIEPDWDYAPRIERGMVTETAVSMQFTTTKAVDFGFSSSYDPTEVSVYNTNATTGRPEQYLLTKTVTALSGLRKLESISVGASKEYSTFLLNQKDVQSIESVTDSDGSNWLEVPYLAQETVFDETVNSVANDPTLSQDKDQVPYILKLKTSKRRFITRVTAENKLELRFGAGISNSPDESFIPNPENVGSNLPGSVTNLDKSFDPSNFLYTNTYGQAPGNTTLLITYKKGYGLDANVGTSEINTVASKTVSYDTGATLISGTKETVNSSITCTNLEAATGGTTGEDLEAVRNNALAHYATQNRVVTREDYIVRTLGIPSRFGTVAKAYVASDEQLTEQGASLKNPLAINLYTLTYDRDKRLTTLSAAAKENLKTYLSQYRMLTDAVNIKDGYIVNIGIDFAITVTPGHNSNVVLLRTIDALKAKLNIDKLSFNTPIYEKDLYVCIADILGVQSVLEVIVKNLYGGSYSPHRYNIKQGTYNSVIYPSLDPSVFEIKYPDTDIQGKVISY